TAQRHFSLAANGSPAARGAEVQAAGDHRHHAPLVARQWRVVLPLAEPRPTPKSWPSSSSRASGFCVSRALDRIRGQDAASEPLAIVCHLRKAENGRAERAVDPGRTVARKLGQLLEDPLHLLL